MSKKIIKKVLEPSKIDRKIIPSRLAGKFGEDYKIALAEFPESKKVEFIEHLSECFDMIKTYMANPTDENWKIYADKQDAFLVKHGKRLKMYRQLNMYHYFDFHLVLVEKRIYTPEDWNALSIEEQELSLQEYTSFVYFCRNLLSSDRNYLLLAQTPEDEREEKQHNNLLGLVKTKGKAKRQVNDKLTCLNQEQTVLLIHYLKQARVLLKDENLNNVDAGIAFEVLTGYSKNTIRNTLGKYDLYHTKENLMEVENLLNRLQIAVKKALKEK